MTEIKAKISELRELCELTSLKGKDIKGKQIMPLPEFLANAENGVLKIQGVDKGAHLALELSYKMEVVKPGPIIIGDVEKFLSFLDRFGSNDDIILSTTENKIIITRSSSQKVARIPQAEATTVETSKNASEFLSKFVKGDSGYYETSKTKFDVKLTLKAEDIKSVIDDGEAVKQRIYPWNLEGPLTVKVGSEQAGEIETVIPITKIETQNPESPIVKTAYAYGLDNIFGNLKGEVIVNLANNIGSCPLIVDKVTDKYTLRIILAPAVTEE